uniref:inositol-phosphate phosphatase n=1 Tax=Globodera rostochiensis TaxID=31243 RepID=A0A914I6L7_GLORO
MTFIRINLRNTLFFLIASSFIYLAFLIWTAKDRIPEFEVQLRDVLSYVVLAAEMGGHAIVRTFAENRKLRVVEKSQMDVGRPELLTKADLISNHLMLSLLRRFPLLKVISEEKSEFLSEKDVEQYRADNYELWLGLREALSKFPSWRIPLARITVWIDPLDATQEFTEGLTQYVTVMACVAIDGKPIFGAIHSPFLNETVFGMVDHGLFDSNGLPISVPSDREDKLQKTILISRSHAGTVSDLIKRAFVNDSTSYVIEPAGGAGYKTLRLIRQSADLYIHTMAIKKWDLCAGDALIRSAGGVLLALDNGLPIDYSAKTAAATKTSDQIEVHKNGFLMTLRSPFSFYQRFKKVCLNQLELRRLSLLEEYFCLNKGVQSLLAEFRLNLARARSTSGAVGASVSDLLSSEKELEPAIWVETSEIAEDSSDFAFFTLKYAASKCTGTGNDLRERINKTAKEDGNVHLEVLNLPEKTFKRCSQSYVIWRTVKGKYFCLKVKRTAKVKAIH